MRFLVIALVALVAVAPAWAGCTSSGYSYGGVQAAAPARGIAATLTPTRQPDVTSGHIAAWVGVGGAGQGANGEDEWLQIGISALPGGPTEVYYEVTLPGQKTKYTSVLPLTALESHRVGVVETRPDVWVARLDGRAVSPAFTLPGSSGRWRPMATTESYDGGYTACNAYAFEIDKISVSGATKLLQSFSSGGHLLRRPAANDVVVTRG